MRYLLLLLAFLLVTLTVDPVLAQESNLEIGTRLKEEGRCEEAIPYFDAAIEKGIDLYDAYVRKAKCLLETSQFEDAIQYAYLAAEVENDKSYPYTISCQSYYWLKDFEKTAEDGIKATILFPDSTLGHYCAALGLQYTDHDEQAIYHLDKSIENSPSPVKFMMRAESYIAIGNYDKAMKDLDSCLQIDNSYDRCIAAKENLSSLSNHSQ